MPLPEDQYIPRYILLDGDKFVVASGDEIDYYGLQDDIVIELPREDDEVKILQLLHIELGDPLVVVDIVRDLGLVGKYNCRSYLLGYTEAVMEKVESLHKELNKENVDYH